MPPRIDSAEILSFRLHVPTQALSRLVRDLKNELPLALVEDATGLKLCHEKGQSFLRFRTRGEESFLVEVVLREDEQGLFFQRVLGELLIQYQGDLQVKLKWNDAERNTHGPHALVTVRQGASRYPGLSRPANALRNTLVAAGDGGESGDDNPFGPADGAPEAPSPADDELLAEVERLLAKGKAHWAEYQRLKAGNK